MEGKTSSIRYMPLLLLRRSIVQEQKRSQGNDDVVCRFYFSGIEIADGIITLSSVSPPEMWSIGVFYVAGDRLKKLELDGFTSTAVVMLLSKYRTFDISVCRNCRYDISNQSSIQYIETISTIYRKYAYDISKVRYIEKLISRCIETVDTKYRKFDISICRNRRYDMSKVRYFDRSKLSIRYIEILYRNFEILIYLSCRYDRYICISKVRYCDIPNLSILRYTIIRKFDIAIYRNRRCDISKIRNFRMY